MQTETREGGAEVAAKTPRSSGYQEPEAQRPTTEALRRPGAKERALALMACWGQPFLHPPIVSLSDLEMLRWGGCILNMGPK